MEHQLTRKPGESDGHLLNRKSTHSVCPYRRHSTNSKTRGSKASVVTARGQGDCQGQGGGTQERQNYHSGPYLWCPNLNRSKPKERTAGGNLTAANAKSHHKVGDPSSQGKAPVTQSSTTPRASMCDLWQGGWASSSGATTHGQLDTQPRTRASRTEGTEERARTAGC